MDNLQREFDDVFQKLKGDKKTIHCLTNPISMNDMANVILSLNASPFMADNPKEVSQITRNSSALLINLGNISDLRMESMLISLKEANDINIPVVIDLVGVAASKYRLDFAKKLVENFNISVIKGNYSEIESLAKDVLTTNSVDSNNNDVSYISSCAKELSKRYKTCVLATGKTDIVVDNNKLYLLHNGSEKLAKITGTGCILGGIISTILSVKNTIYGVILAISILNISSELIKEAGMGSFKVKLLDEISLIDSDKILRSIKLEEIN